MKLVIITAILMAMVIGVSAQQVTLYEATRQRGPQMHFGIGVHQHDRNMRNAQSISIPAGFLVEACYAPPAIRPYAECVTYPEGNYDLYSLNKKVGYLSVTLPQDALAGKQIARVYTNRNQMGVGLALMSENNFVMSQYFVGGSAVVDSQAAPRWSNTASSIQIREGYRAVINRGNNPGMVSGVREPNQITLRAGRHNLPQSFDGNIIAIKIERDVAPGVFDQNTVRRPVVKRW